MNPKVARGYVRESTERQGEKFGPDAQRGSIRRAARDLGLGLDESRWYVDLVSGTGRAVRDDLRTAMRDARNRQFEVLICYDTSRWARNERDAFNFEAEMHAAGVRVYYVAERIWSDDTTEGAAISKGVMHVLNAQFSRTLGRKIRDGLAAKRARGGYAGGVPWGYRFSGDKMSLERTTDHPLRLRIWEEYATGAYTLASLADRLNAEGRTFRRGRPFTKFTLHEVLRRDVDVRLGGLAPEVYERVQSILASRRRAMAKVGQRRRGYLLADLARCAKCGERFIGRAFWRPGATAAITQLKHAPRGCGRGIRSERVLASRIGEWLDEWRLPGDVRTRIARYLRRRGALDPNAGHRRRLEAAVARLRKQHEWGAITDAEFLREHGILAKSLADLGPAAVIPPPSEDALKLAASVGRAWRSVSDERRKQFLTEWFAEVRLAPDGRITMVPREQYRPIVYAAVVGTVGCAGFEPATSAM